MTRAVFISSSMDPFLLLFQIDLLKRCWEEFDKLYICLNNYSDVSKEVESELITKLLDDPKIHLIYYPYPIGYGLPINKMLGCCTEDLILLLEDDGFIFTRGKINEYFKLIESDQFDALGSPRFSCGTEIVEALKLKYNLDYSGLGDKGPNFWPNFFFCKREDLLNTDLNFGSKSFEAGIFYPELNYTMKETEGGDTFVWTGIQMRANGVRFGEIPQFHASPTEIEDKEKGEMNWVNGNPFWIHGGSLSVGAGEYFKGVIPEFANESAKMEFETRVAFWIIALGQVDGFVKFVNSGSFRGEYAKSIDNLCKDAKLNDERIGKKIAIYKELMGI